MAATAAVVAVVVFGHILPKQCKGICSAEYSHSFAKVPYLHLCLSLALNNLLYKLQLVYCPESIPTTTTTTAFAVCSGKFWPDQAKVALPKALHFEQ